MSVMNKFKSKVSSKIRYLCTDSRARFSVMIMAKRRLWFAGVKFTVKIIMIRSEALQGERRFFGFCAAE